jgi:hypothetical protein
MVSCEGLRDTGKTEFALSCPGPGVVLCVDRGYEPVLDNPNPPSARQTDFAFIEVPNKLPTAATQAQYLEYWTAFYNRYTKALDNADVRTVVIDGDSDTWEMQRLAEFGKTNQVPSLRYPGVNAARRAMYARAHDAKKIIIGTNKLKKAYRTIYKPNGDVVLGDDGKEKREWDGKSYDAQGFEDKDYLWNIQIRHLRRETKDGYEWGLVILDCKVQPDLAGYELWGDDCNFAGLVQTCYPDVPLKEWGFK